MASTYKTPGVYVEEITKFPPSVAAVETAIPAFIGYTEKAVLDGESLLKTPRLIWSLADFEQIYGGPSSLNVTVTLDDEDRVSVVAPNAKFYLYDSLRLFYDNGGGRCYIISIGYYKDNLNSKNFDDFTDALGKLKSEDEPTLILAPDATLLSGINLFNFQKQALLQCNDLMDRFLICDLKEIDQSNLQSKIDEFRNNIGIQNLKYSAAYAPWLKTTLTKNLKYRNLSLQREGGGIVKLESLTQDQEIKDFILNRMNKAKSIVDKINDKITTLINDVNLNSLKAKLNKLISDVEAVDNSADNISNYQATLVSLYGFLRDSMHDFLKDDYRNSLPDVNGFKVKSSLNDAIIDNDLDSAFQELVHYSNGFRTKQPNGSKFNILTAGGSKLTDLKGTIENLLTGVTIDITLGDGNQNPTIVALYASASSTLEAVLIAIQGTRRTFKLILAAIEKYKAAAEKFEETFDMTLKEIFGTYKNILDGVNRHLTIMPPSGAVAGVYAAVDADQGVWKAPANVSLNSVLAPTVTISHELQQDMNVDVNAGKSINAIRSFTGKGVLVWGARTLAGNDNEWRYISVRRFFNMVEESTKKATSQFVFEPNDANTWVRVKAMIENFLTLQWRAGALAGAKAEHAYYVKVGLGETMTSLDILEGRMIVEIGMAVVRPAEFIILRFSHKMQES